MTVGDNGRGTMCGLRDTRDVSRETVRLHGARDQAAWPDIPQDSSAVMPPVSPTMFHGEHHRTSRCLSGLSTKSHPVGSCDGDVVRGR